MRPRTLIDFVNLIKDVDIKMAVSIHAKAVELLSPIFIINCEDGDGVIFHSGEMFVTEYSKIDRAIMRNIRTVVGEDPRSNQTSEELGQEVRDWLLNKELQARFESARASGTVFESVFDYGEVSIEVTVHPAEPSIDILGVPFALNKGDDVLIENIIKSHVENADATV